MIDLMENKVLGPAIRQGLEQGLEQGLLQGRQEGLQQGLQQEAAQILRRLLQRRFGPLPGWAENKLTTASQETLESWIDRLDDAGSLDRIFG